MGCGEMVIFMILCLGIEKKKQYQKTATPETETNKKTTVPGSRRAA